MKYAYYEIDSALKIECLVHIYRQRTRLKSCDWPHLQLGNPRVLWREFQTVKMEASLFGWDQNYLSEFCHKHQSMMLLGNTLYSWAQGPPLQDQGSSCGRTWRTGRTGSQTTEELLLRDGSYSTGRPGNSHRHPDDCRHRSFMSLGYQQTRYLAPIFLQSFSPTYRISATQTL